MQNRYRHPLAAHAALTALGYRRNGLPIYNIAGGATPPGPAPVVTPPATPPATPPVVTPPAPTPPVVTPPAPPEGDVTDWKTESRKWEARSKANDKAAADLAALKAASLTDQEKAVEAARTEGRTAAESTARATAVQLAVVRGAIKAGADHEALLDTTSFMASLADVDPTDATAVKAAIDKAVKANAKLAAAAPVAGSSGPPLPGGPGTTTARPTSLGAAIGAHYNAG